VRARVPTFYFHVCDGHRFDGAQEGRELPDAKAARLEAISGLRDLIAADVCRGEANLGMFVEVEDASGQLLFTVSVEDAVQVRSERGTSPRR
jgi:hypothetical protein